MSNLSEKVPTIFNSIIQGPKWPDCGAMLIAVYNAHSLGTRFCFKFTSVPHTCTACHSANFYKTPGVIDMVGSQRGDCWRCCDGSRTQS